MACASQAEERLRYAGTSSPVQRLASPYGMPAAGEEPDLDDEDSSEDEPASGDDLQEAPLQELQGQDGGAQDAVSEHQAIKTLAGEHILPHREGTHQM